MSEAKLDRTIARFQAKIDSGSYYEAHQTLRTITNRYVKSKQYPEACEILYQGSSILTRNKQYASSSDLISYLIQVYIEAGITSENRDAKLKLIELIGNLPDSEKSLIDLSKQSLNWSKDGNHNKFGDCDLHDLFGSKFLNIIGTTENDDKLFAIAELHLILGTHESLPKYILFLFNWFKTNKQVDAGLFLSRAIINYSYLKNLKFVQESLNKYLILLKTYNSNYQEISHDAVSILFFEEYPLINFLQMLVLTLGKQNCSNKFLGLYNEYKTMLEEYGIVNSIEYIGKLYFDLNIGKPKSGNMMANLLGDFFK